MEQNEYLLEMLNIDKSFSGVQALKNARLQVRPGTVHALLGENGAGKSTLMKLLLGIYHPDQGTILFKGETLKNHSPQQALDKGISMIHQELSPVLDMRVCDNIFLGREPVKYGLVDDKRLFRDTEELLQSLGMTDLDPLAKMCDLSVAQTQMVEIAKAVSYKADLIIMDEPTSTISEAEVQILFSIIRDLRARGISIIYISHKMSEIFEITDEFTVFRDGAYIATGKTCDMTQEELVTMMVARNLSQYYVKTPHEIGESVLAVEGMCLPGRLYDISFSLRRGEILGFAGLVGAGRTEIVETLFGLRKKSAGTIRIKGEEVQINSIQDAIHHGIALATEDRKKYGLFLGLSVRQNVCVCWLDHLCDKLGFVRKNKEYPVVADMIRNLKIKTPSQSQQVANLSGGNQQKIVLAKWLCTSPDILILDEPTRGIDVGAKAEIYGIMDELTKAGKSIIMISSEMPEIIGMSDRVLVVSEGRIKGELTGKDIDQENVIRYAAG